MNILESFILLLVIMDPVVSLSAFLALARSKSEKKRREIAAKATLVAAFVFLVFAFGGNLALYLLGVEITSFKAAGGIILIIFGIQMVLGLSLFNTKEISDLAVVIGTPLISGPATIMTTIILVKEIGLISTLISGLSAVFVAFLFLIFAFRLDKILGKTGIRLLATMMGIVTISWGIEFLLSGIIGFL